MRFLSLLLLVACADTAPRTQVMVFVRAEPAVIARTQRLEIEIYGAAPGGERSLRDTLIYTDSTSPDFFALEWPRRVALIPEGQDPDRLFTVVATAYESELGPGFSRTEVTSSYLREQTLTLDVWLRDDCIGRSCTSGTTCVAGDCVRVEPIDPCNLRVLETLFVPDGCMMDGGMDSGSDAAPGPDGGSDGGSDGGRDSGTDAGPDAGPDPLDVYNVVFVSSEDFVPGDLGGIDAAHAHCDRLATNASLPAAVYRAFLSTSSAPATDLLDGSRGFVRVDGLPFADRPSDLVTGKIFYPILLNENGDPVTDPVMTGTTEGLIAANTCEDWTESMAVPVNAGNPFDGAPFWLNRDFGFGNAVVRCNERTRIYCFGTGRNEELVPPVAPTGSGGVFLSTAQVEVDESGTDDFDAVCQAEGGASYVAFLPVNADDSAMSRVRSFRGPWARQDGVVVGGYNDLALGQLSAAINVSATGAYRPGNARTVVGVWSNAVQPDAVSGPETSCVNWTNTSNAQDGRVAYFGRAHAPYAESYPVECSIAGGYHVYCISTGPVPVDE